MDLFEILIVLLLIGYLITLLLILISDGDLSLMFWDKFGKKIGKYILRSNLYNVLISMHIILVVKFVTLPFLQFLI